MELTRAAGLRGDSPPSLRESDENRANILSLVFQDNTFKFSFLKWGQSITKTREMTGHLPEAWQTHFISAGFLWAHRRWQLFHAGCAAGQQVWREAPACEPGVRLYEYVRVKRTMDSFLTGIHTYQDRSKIPPWFLNISIWRSQQEKTNELCFIFIGLYFSFVAFFKKIS